MAVNHIRFNGILLEIEDTIARQQASTAVTKATSAQNTANIAGKTATQASQRANGAAQTAARAEKKVNDLADNVDNLPSWSYSNKTLEWQVLR